MTSVRPMSSTDGARLHLRYDSLFSRASIQEHARDYGDLVWTNDQNEYIIGGRWKSREAIGEILELSGPGRGFRGFFPTPLRDDRWPERRAALIEALIGSYRQRGADLVLLNEREAERNLRPFLEARFEVVEDIVYYHNPSVRLAPPRHRLTLRQLGFGDIPALVRLEQRVFPWLWWYGDDEWYMITLLKDVETNLAYLNGRLVGYETHTVRGEHGHLDRLGIDPAVQGQGLGEELLLRSVRRIAELGGDDVGLSTQRNNARARRLYEKHGFRVTSRVHRYYGSVLNDAIRERLTIDTP